MNESETTQAALDWSNVLLRLWMQDFNRYVRGAGLSLAEVSMLMHLYCQGPCEVLAFGDFLQLSRSGASQMVERLVQQGLVQRSETPGDRRVRLVHLTERGRQVVDESIRAGQQWMERLVAALTDEQQAAVGDAMRLLTEQAARLDAQAFPGADS